MTRMAGEELFSADPTTVLTSTFGISKEIAIVIFLIIGVWSLTWKGLALWKAARKPHKIWFVVLLVANTIGILEILYIYIFSEIEFDKKSNKESNKKIKKK
jgi:hypothetical protein